MSVAKRRKREFVRKESLHRDNGCCRICGAAVGYLCPDGEVCEELDPHHITPRELMPNGGYVLGNIITLCEYCHDLAEAYLNDEENIVDSGPEYAPSSLYKLIGGTYQRALMEDENSDL